MEDRFIKINGPTLLVQSKANSPFLLVQELAVTVSNTGEEISIVRSAMNPLKLSIWGDKLSAELDLNPIIQEALLHVLRENSPDWVQPEKAVEVE